MKTEQIKGPTGSGKTTKLSTRKRDALYLGKEVFDLTSMTPNAVDYMLKQHPGTDVIFLLDETTDPANAKTLVTLLAHDHPGLLIYTVST